MEEDETKSALLNSDKVVSSNDENLYTNITSSYKNGLNRFELLMSMAGDYNKNLPASNPLPSIRSLTQDSLDMDFTRSLNTNRNHASQLLMAAASVVSNGFGANGLHSFLPDKTSGSLETYSGSHMQTLPSMDEVAHQTAARNIHHVERSTTVVSFSSKPTMSTGFPSTPMMQTKSSDSRMLHASSSLFEPSNTLHSEPMAKASPVVKSEPRLTKLTPTVVPFLWKRIYKDGVIQYHRFAVCFFLF